MTAIVGVLNSQGIAIAADSAVTVTGNNVKKVYNRSNKIFTLSKYHPVGIAIYNNAEYQGIPLETIIKMYRKHLGENSFSTLEEYKINFLDFLRQQLSKVGVEQNRNSYFSFCFEAYNTIIKTALSKLKNRQIELDAVDAAGQVAIFSEEFNNAIQDYDAIIANYPAANYIALAQADYFSHYDNELTDIINHIQNEIQGQYPGFVLAEPQKLAIKNTLFSLNNIEYIFERHSGLIFIGFGEDEIYPSSHLVLVGYPVAGQPRMRIYPCVTILPGVHDSNILPYAQADVTTTVLTGVDPNYKDEVKQSISTAFQEISVQVTGFLNDPDQIQQVNAAMNTISHQLIDKLETYQFQKITGPLLEILAHMGKEDMSELAESLVNITSLKRKFTSSDSNDESVGGPVDVAIITKGDGFVWMKRKHYFSIENNQGFMDKYFKI